MLADTAGSLPRQDPFGVGIEVVIGLIVIAFVAYVVLGGVGASRRGENVAVAVLKAIAIGLPAVILSVGGILLLVSLVAILVVVVVILALSGTSNLQGNQLVAALLIGIAIALLVALSIAYVAFLLVRRLVRGRRPRSRPAHDLEPPPPSS